MQLSAKLPAELWPETWQAAAYLHNRSPREANLWKSPLETFKKWLRDNGRDVPELHDKPNLSNLYAYGCRAYPLKESILKDVDRVSRRTSPRTHLGYLVGYEGGNIYRIWVPSDATVIRTRDVEFNEDEFFNPDTEQRLEDPLHSFQLKEPGPEPVQEHLDSDAESTIYVATPNDDNGQETHQDRPDELAKADPPADNSTESAAYPTPDSSRDSSPQGDADTPPPEPQAESHRPRRNRQLTDRAQQNVDQSGNPFQAGYAVAPVTLASFHTGTQHRLHRRNLPPEPRSWKELQCHTFKAEFTEATKKE
jgi:hypothetical protein